MAIASLSSVRSRCTPSATRRPTRPPLDGAPKIEDGGGHTPLERDLALRPRIEHARLVKTCGILALERPVSQPRGAPRDGRYDRKGERPRSLVGIHVRYRAALGEGACALDLPSLLASQDLQRPQTVGVARIGGRSQNDVGSGEGTVEVTNL